ncbi:hypothetical protein ASPACDRAFT_79701 [Aspergillus aculeatus ATCC 16872]|uniref:CBM-cenC domain-containing protein n=1 Tax=Aspergillus aculeatus (strain ATCC 16872 / CBS 172.66 / WB 5094) TaxID=690307 RepID=A0A1L9WS51_ASPA1|nr:uncharacterized protein ASPACDRAFT_79701 [Aspergillus aculeatus ATCC 16872]OJJ99006.1 hypothetical protein ASPACDRAFT_79701 [Aspergillus aculeatus ATCC 16872]
MARPLFTSAVVAGVLAHSVAASVTCSTEIVNAFSNPSFETGDATDWTAWIASATPSTMGNVLSGEASDGNYYLSIDAATSVWKYIQQPVTGLQVGKTYTLSVDYKVTAAIASIPAIYNTCYMGWMVDRWSSVLGRITVPAILGGLDPSWETYTYSFTPTSSSHTMMFLFACSGYTTFNFELDNFVLPLSTQQVCTTSAEVVTPTTSAVAISPSSVSPSSAVSATPTPSSAVSPASSVAVISSTAIPPSSPAVPSSPAYTPTTLSFSALVTPTASVASSSSVVASTPAVSSQSIISASSSVSIPIIRPSQSTANSVIPPRSSPIRSLSSFVPSSSPAVSFASSHPVVTRSAGQSSAPGFTSSPVRTFATSIFQPGRIPSSAPNVGPSQSSIPAVTPSISSHESRTTIGSASADTGGFITSTLLTTRTATVTACPSSVANCPASERTTSLTTETVVIGTTICPATIPAGQPTASAGAGPEGELLTTSTVFTTRTSTITACPSTVPNCPASAHSTYVITETLVDYTTVCPITATQTAASTATGHAVVATGTAIVPAQTVSAGNSAATAAGHTVSSAVAPAVTQPASESDEVVSTIYVTATVTVDCSN